MPCNSSKFINLIHMQTIPLAAFAATTYILQFGQTSLSFHGWENNIMHTQTQWWNIIYNQWWSWMHRAVSVTSKSWPLLEKVCDQHVHKVNTWTLFSCDVSRCCVPFDKLRSWQGDLEYTTLNKRSNVIMHICVRSQWLRVNVGRLLLRFTRGPRSIVDAER